MKARVKATGEIVDVYESCSEDFPWTDEMGDKVWKTEELTFLETTEKDPDYWTRLEHQAAIGAMQGILSNANHALWDRENNAEGIAKSAAEIAHALVEKLKGKEE